MRTFGDAARVLGDLEQRTMDLLWDASPLGVREVQRRLGGRLAYTTVMTTLDRLYKKELLAREKIGLAFEYRPAIDRDEYQRRIVEATLTPLLEGGSHAALAAFVDVAAGVSEDNLARLTQLIADRTKR